MQLWIKRYTNDNCLETRFKNNSGRSRITSEEVDTAVFEYASDKKIVSAVEIGGVFGLHRKLVGRRLKERGLKCHRPAMKTLLNPEHRANRIAFIEENYGRDWERVVFSDEKVFKSYSDRKMPVYRPKNKRFAPEYIQNINKAGRISCGVWGFITSGGFGELVPITGRMKSDEYISILDEVYIPSMEAIFGDASNDFIFMHDNSGVHKSRATTAYLQQHPEIAILNWPSKSPDMNIIENVWGRMTYRWDAELIARSKEAVLNEATRRWNLLIGDTAYIDNLYGSMTRRFDQILENGGHWCKY